MHSRHFDEIWNEPVHLSSDDSGDDEPFLLRLLRAARQGAPNDEMVLFALGNALTELEKHEEALEVDRRLVAIRQEDPVCHYNLACSYSNLGRVDEAIDELREAFDLGYWDIEHMENDSDLENVRQDPRYEELLSEHFDIDVDYSEFL